jgi:hypothetical protein
MTDSSIRAAESMIGFERMGASMISRERKKCIRPRQLYECKTKYLREVIQMTHDFKVGDHVEWNSEAGRVRGTIKKKVTSAITFKGYTVHASNEEPQYLIKSDKTEHLAMHKGSALEKISKIKRSTKDPLK